MKNTKTIAPNVAVLNRSGSTLPEIQKPTSKPAHHAAGVGSNSKYAARNTKKSRKPGEKNSEPDLRYMGIRTFSNDAETLAKNKVVSPDPATMPFRFRDPKSKTTYFFSNETRYQNFLNKQAI